MVIKNRTLFLILVSAYLLGLSSSFWLDWQLAFVIAANCFFIVYLTLAVVNFDHMSGRATRMIIRRSAEPSYVIFAVTIATVASALVALFRILSADSGDSQAWLIIALLSVPLGWATIHTMAAFQYAKLFWGKLTNGQLRRGLQFPEGNDPDGWDFVYFSFVIGMAAQTADVSIADRSIRRFALAHSVVAYFFNAVLIAAAVNVVVGGN